MIHEIKENKYFKEKHAIINYNANNNKFYISDN